MNIFFLKKKKDYIFGKDIFIYFKRLLIFWNQFKLLVSQDFLNQAFLIYICLRMFFWNLESDAYI